MAIFNSYVTNYQRVTLITHTPEGSSHSPIPMLSTSKFLVNTSQIHISQVPLGLRQMMKVWGRAGPKRRMWA